MFKDKGLSLLTYSKGRKVKQKTDSSKPTKVLPVGGVKAVPNEF